MFPVTYSTYGTLSFGVEWIEFLVVIGRVPDSNLVRQQLP
jgi:hypothetical protein